MRPALFALCLSLSACAPRAGAPRVAHLPDAKVMTLEGRATSLRDAIGGRVAVLDFWATWCEACEEERGKLARLSAAYAKSGLVVVGLNVGEEPERVAEYVRRHAVPYPVYLDPEFRMAQALDESNLPSVLVVAPSGQVVHRSTQLDRETVQRVSKLLRDNPTTPGQR
jgi:thiol-disulfide isomerase/thioredoxin